MRREAGLPGAQQPGDQGRPHQRALPIVQEPLADDPEGLSPERRLHRDLREVHDPRRVAAPHLVFSELRQDCRADFAVPSEGLRERSVRVLRLARCVSPVVFQRGRAVLLPWTGSVSLDLADAECV